MSTASPRPHSVSTAFVDSAVRGLAPAMRARVLAEAGIEADAGRKPGARVPAPAFAALWMAVARELDDEFFGLDSRRMKVGSFALLCHAAAAQTTVERALQMSLRGFATCFDDIAAGLSVAGREARLTISNRIHADVDEPDARRFADETLLVMLHGLLCWLAGRRVPLSRLDFAHAQPAHADEYRRMFSPHVRFDQPSTAIAFDIGVLVAAVSMSEGSLKAFLRDAPQSVFLKQVATGGWAERTRRHLQRAMAVPRAGGAARGPMGPADTDAQLLDHAAAHFGVSPATLRRRLEGEGTRWQQLKDEVRRELAMAHLADRRLSIEQVAALLGFNDGPSFHRAFRKWTGAPPGAFRVGRMQRLPHPIRPEPANA